MFQGLRRQCAIVERAQALEPRELGLHSALLLTRLVSLDKPFQHSSPNLLICKVALVIFSRVATKHANIMHKILDMS